VNAPDRRDPPRGAPLARPRVLVARSAAQRIHEEVERWARRGLREGDSPFEAIVYPLSALVRRRPRSGGPTPLELSGPEDLEALVIADAALPPEEAKHFGTHNCHFDGPDLQALNAAFNAEIAARIEQSPRLDVHAKLHSHPFGGGDWLSGMDVQVNVMTPGAALWRERLGLAVTFLSVCYPDRDPAAMLRTAAPGRWHVATFAVTPAGKVARLPDARVVPDDHPAVQRARAPAYWQTDVGRAWDDAQKAALRAAGFRTSRGLLRRGWRRYIVTLADGRDLCFCIPPSLDDEAVRVLHVVDGPANLFRPLPVARGVAGVRAIADLDLVALARAYDRARPAPGGKRRRKAGAGVGPESGPTTIEGVSR